MRKILYVLLAVVFLWTSLVPLIINVQPVRSVPMFLGLGQGGVKNS